MFLDDFDPLFSGFFAIISSSPPETDFWNVRITLSAPETKQIEATDTDFGRHCKTCDGSLLSQLWFFRIFLYFTKIHNCAFSLVEIEKKASRTPKFLQIVTHFWTPPHPKIHCQHQSCSVIPEITLMTELGSWSKIFSKSDLSGKRHLKSRVGALRFSRFLQKSSPLKFVKSPPCWRF